MCSIVSQPKDPHITTPSFGRESGPPRGCVCPHMPLSGHGPKDSLGPLLKGILLSPADPGRRVPSVKRGIYIRSTRWVQPDSSPAPRACPWPHGTWGVRLMPSHRQTPIIPNVTQPQEWTPAPLQREGQDKYHPPITQTFPLLHPTHPHYHLSLPTHEVPTVYLCVDMSPIRCNFNSFFRLEKSVITTITTVIVLIVRSTIVSQGLCERIIYSLRSNLRNNSTTKLYLVSAKFAAK